MVNTKKDPAICCPEFDPLPWDNKAFTWNKKKFIKNSVKTMFYMPLNLGSVMQKMQKQVNQSDARIPSYLCLAEHTTRWNMDIYLAVDKEVKGAKNVTLSGKYLSKVYDGPFKDIGKWRKDFKVYAKEKKFAVKKWFMWYTTCPKCAKKYGHNYVVIVAEVK